METSKALTVTTSNKKTILKFKFVLVLQFIDLLGVGPCYLYIT